MKISYNWLKDYIQPLPSPEKTAEILTSIGLEVESIEEHETIRGGLKGIVVGEVLSCGKHPNADKLVLTTVSVGNNEQLQIVCGAPNVAVGQKVPVATIGTTVFKGSESLTIKRSKIRGEISEGMICAEDELGLGDSHQGIMVLDPSAENGTPVSEYFNILPDFIFEIGLTPNRIDAASHFGVARDLAAFLGQREEMILSKPSVQGFIVEHQENVIPVEIVEKKACPRYSGLTISGIRVGESPDWLKRKLLAIGLNPINNVVDITNYVLHELGQPLHAFDADKITGRKVIVRTLPEGTRFTALDGKEIELDAEDLMICNTQEGMCIAGVFGGFESGVKEETRNIFLESACFNPMFIRKTSRRHLLFTDSAFRFERGSDPEMTVFALKRAAILIREVAGGSISSGIIDVYPEKIHPAKVMLAYRNLDRLVGQELDRKKVRAILASLDIQVISENSSGLELEIPTYRVDVGREADVIEEIIRIYGYNNIHMSTVMNSSLSHVQKPDKEAIGNMVSDILSSNGFYEIMCNSLTRSSYYEDEPGANKELVRIYNPLSSDLNSLRQTLLFGGLESILLNSNRKNSDLRMYEFGNIYLRHEKDSPDPLDKYYEEERLALFITGEHSPVNWKIKSDRSNFFQIKTYVERIFTRLGLLTESLEIRSTSESLLSEGLDYLSQGILLVSIGKVNENICKQFDIRNEVFYAELRWTEILKKIVSHKTIFTELPKYPEVRRDLSMILEKSVKFERIKDISYKAEKLLLREIILFDVYEGDKIEKGKKSYAVSYILRDDSKTLTDKEIDNIMNAISRMLEKEAGAQIRS